MMRVLLGIVLLAAIFAAAWLARENGAGEPAPRIDVASALGGDAAEGYERATRPGAIALPADHGPHPGFRTEWWYFTGNLDGDDGREFGFQLTFFRFALRPPAAPGDESSLSVWDSGQAFMAHFAISDVAAGEHRVAERVARGAAGIAGATHPPLRVWLDDWEAASTSAALLPLRLAARSAARGIALELVLQPGRGPVLNGEQGLSRKGAGEGNASYYYSYTRLPAAGRISIDGREHAVRGMAWLDREWSTSALEPGTAGWDWFGLTLADGRDLMLYRLRTDAGEKGAASAGTLVLAGGGTRGLSADDFTARPLDWWRSPHTGVRYPVAWELTLQDEPPLRVAALLADQEQDLSVRYWEGAVRVTDAAGSPAGRGYMELTGYGPGGDQPNSAR